jgi:hypothetical protein
VEAGEDGGLVARGDEGAPHDHLPARRTHASLSEIAIEAALRGRLPQESLWRPAGRISLQMQTCVPPMTACVQQMQMCVCLALARARPAPCRARRSARCEVRRKVRAEMRGRHCGTFATAHATHARARSPRRVAAVEARRVGIERRSAQALGCEIARNKQHARARQVQGAATRARAPCGGRRSRAWRSRRRGATPRSPPAG